MGQRLKIGLLFSYYENWIGGTYYFLNLITSLNTLPDSEKPYIYVFTKKSVEVDLIKKTNYPYLIFNTTTLSLLEKGINKVLALSRISTSFFEDAPLLDIIFGSYNNQLESEKWQKVKRKLYWIPDFQEYHFPDFFSSEKIDKRKRRQQFLIERVASIVLSSQHAKRDFNLIYPFQNCKSYVLPFTVSHKKNNHLDIQEIQLKYQIHSPYFITPNQFWKHKNHLCLLRAINAIIKEGYQNVLFVFTGKEFDPRHPTYFEQIKTFVQKNKLENHVRFLGFIDRKEQLLLIQHAKAVIQPSLFEGWSTVIEDGKALGKLVLASNLEVHQEQLGDHALYFNPNSVEELIDKIKEVIKLTKTQQINFQYKNRINNFAKNFLQICQESLEATS